MLRIEGITQDLTERAAAEERINRLANYDMLTVRESELHRAIAEDQLRLHYQPKVDAASGLVTGAEALVRWLHSVRGLVPPLEFIPPAGESGLILALTDFNLRRFRVDKLKIDRSFITGVHRGGRDSAIAASVIALGASSVCGWWPKG
jgi:EAL domain-containing protein (putative c-di-GMP-specific phosphodiesterase class I)